MSFAFAYSVIETFDGALDWYGYNSLLSTELYMQNNLGDGDDDNVERKRRHRRRRKIGPSKKGW
tara:strand:+ start:106 stop:297 length:192 start_codon:yes stop_codon:yes gene_type:complete